MSDMSTARQTPCENTRTAPTDSLSTAELLKELRREFPDMPLAERVAALAALTRA